MTLTRSFTKLDYTIDRQMYCINIVKYSSSTDSSLQCMHMHFKYRVRYTPSINYDFVLVFGRPQDQKEGDSFSDYITSHPLFAIPDIVARMRKAYVLGIGYKKILARYDELLKAGE